MKRTKTEQSKAVHCDQCGRLMKGGEDLYDVGHNNKVCKGCLKDMVSYNDDYESRERLDRAEELCQSEEVPARKLSELTLEVDDLYSALRKLKRVTPRTAKDMPVLAYARIEQVGPTASDVAIAGTDLEKATRVEMQAYDEEIGSDIPIPVYDSWDILKGESGSVKIEYYDNNTVVLEVGGVEYELFVTELEDMPNITKVEGTELVDIVSKEKLEKIFYDFPDFMVSGETTRLSLSGIKFEDGDAVATNGYYMVVEDLGNFGGEFLLGDTSDIKKQCPTLKKIDSELLEVRKEPDGHWIMITDPDHNIQLLFQEIMEDYPDYEAVIPTDNEVQVDLTEDNIEDLHKFTKKVDDLSDKSDPQSVEWKVDGNLRLKHGNPEIGTMKTEVEPRGVDWNFAEPPLTINMKAKFTANILDGEDDLSMWLQDSETAALFANHDRMYIQMPISQDV